MQERRERKEATEHILRGKFHLIFYVMHGSPVCLQKNKTSWQVTSFFNKKIFAKVIFF
jgi:hypothetical protein